MDRIGRQSCEISINRSGKLYTVHTFATFNAIGWTYYCVMATTHKRVMFTFKSFVYYYLNRCATTSRVVSPLPAYDASLLRMLWRPRNVLLIIIIITIIIVVAPGSYYYTIKTLNVTSSTRLYLPSIYGPLR